MNIDKKQNTEEMIAIKCECGKTLAFKRINGEIYVKCRACKRTPQINKPNK